ncbi:predicted protein [Naegleria gruberi]|uniref:Predicted protein n=1 Tax=Naegleria gruberi TaxID=5762 RepID=D2VZE3_NAEGR|nr:uncharacterized protein NAEGRDRAFT_53475 [Naegleria gruberi]EFC37831.1 predicted protein [Naegleria gruberi]|eukprot:XP_002670575.1 predicted protein [Naegleria gruberi strain NEG-M]
MRRFSRFIKGENNRASIPSTTTIAVVTPLAEQSNRTKTPSSPSDRKETNLLEPNWRNSKKQSPHSPLISSSSQDNTASFGGVKKVVSNRKHLFLSHVKQKKIKLDKKEQSCLNNNQNSTSACEQVGGANKNRTNSLESLEQWTSFHSKQGLYSYFYMENSDVIETLRYGQFEMKEPPKIIARRKICA